MRSTEWFTSCTNRRTRTSPSSRRRLRRSRHTPCAVCWLGGNGGQCKRHTACAGYFSSAGLGETAGGANGTRRVPATFREAPALSLGRAGIRSAGVTQAACYSENRIRLPDQRVRVDIRRNRLRARPVVMYDGPPSPSTIPHRRARRAVVRSSVDGLEGPSYRAESTGSEARRTGLGGPSYGALKFTESLHSGVTTGCLNAAFLSARVLFDRRSAAVPAKVCPTQLAMRSFSELTGG